MNILALITGTTLVLIGASWLKIESTNAERPASLLIFMGISLITFACYLP